MLRHVSMYPYTYALDVHTFILMLRSLVCMRLLASLCLGHGLFITCVNIPEFKNFVFSEKPSDDPSLKLLAAPFNQGREQLVLQEPMTGDGLQLEEVTIGSRFRRTWCSTGYASESTVYESVSLFSCILEKWSTICGCSTSP